MSAAVGRTFSPHDRQPPSEDVCPSSALLGPCWLLGPLVPLPGPASAPPLLSHQACQQQRRPAAGTECAKACFSTQRRLLSSGTPEGEVPHGVFGAMKSGEPPPPMEGPWPSCTEQRLLSRLGRRAGSPGLPCVWSLQKGSAGDGGSRAEAQRLQRQESPAGSVTLGAADGIFTEREAARKEQVQEPPGAFCLQKVKRKELLIETGFQGTEGGFLVALGALTGLGVGPELVRSCPRPSRHRRLWRPRRQAPWPPTPK